MNGLNCVTDTSEAIRPTSFFLFLFFFFSQYTTNTHLLVHQDAGFLQGLCFFRRRSVPLPLPSLKKKKKKTCIEKKEKEEKNKKTSAILRRFCRIRADILLSDSLCSRSHSDVVCNPHISLGDMPFTLTVMMIMHPIFPPFPFFFLSSSQDAQSAQAPTSAIVETTLPMQSDAQPWSPIYLFIYFFGIFFSK